MNLLFKVNHREIEIRSGGGLYLKTTQREVHATRDAGGAWWPHWDRIGEREGVIHGLGWCVVYCSPEHFPVRQSERKKTGAKF